MLLKQVRELVSANHTSEQPIVILIEDVPLKAQIATQMAADYGSRVQVEKTEINSNTILVCGWQFWHARSYGRQILSALEPYAKVNYLDQQFFQDKD